MAPNSGKAHLTIQIVANISQLFLFYEFGFATKSKQSKKAYKEKPYYQAVAV